MSLTYYDRSSHALVIDFQYFIVCSSIKFKGWNNLGRYSIGDLVISAHFYVHVYKKNDLCALDNLKVINKEIAEFQFYQQNQNGITNSWNKRKNPGHGRYIYKVQQVEDNQFYVLKKQSQMNDNERKLIEFSIKQPHQLQHLIQFYEIFTQAENECIISEYCSGGDLRAFMEKQSLKPDQIVMIVVDVCKALKELQAFSFYHRDIKPENIVISVDPFTNKTKYKLIDYGELKMDSEKMKELGGTIKYTENTGTLNYMAPEIISNKNKNYNRSVDIWSLGTMIYEFYAQTQLFDGEKYEIMNSIVNQEDIVREQKIDELKIEYQTKQLLKLMLKKDPQKRPGVDTILDYFKKQMDQCTSNNVSLDNQFQERFDILALKLFSDLQEQFKPYRLNTKNLDYFQQFFLKTLIKQPPSFSEVDQIFEIFKRELIPEQFKLIEKSCKTYVFYETFQWKIKHKIEKQSESDIIPTLVYVTQETMKKYLQQDFLRDLNNFLIYYMNEDKKYIKYEIKRYFDLLEDFGIFYKQTDLMCFIDEVLYPEIFKQQFSLSSDLTKQFSEFLKKFQYQSSLTSKYSFTQMKKQFKSLEFQCLEIKKDLIDCHIKKMNQQEPIIVIEIRGEFFVNEQMNSKDKEVFQQIIDPHWLSPFRSQIIQTMTNSMSKENQGGWRKLYSDIYQAISREIKIDNVNQQEKEKIMSNIKKLLNRFNLQFCHYGVIFNDVGESCIYYFAILVIWRYICYGQWKIMSNI